MMLNINKYNLSTFNNIGKNNRNKNISNVKNQFENIIFNEKHENDKINKL